ncbi:MAG: PDC sensor domain-containing protein [Candidatus Thiodiazotropha sp. (ex Lucinoma borealis)]|nr:PDC sensor domain-containing protein [Candidatus Thiodiazotropha sp. (ex Lucinoma borealis)]
MFSSSLWRLYLFLVVSSMALFYSVGHYKWSNIEKEALSDLTYSHKLITRSAHQHLRKHAVMLKLLGRRLIDIEAFENRDSAKKLMEELLQDNQETIGYGLSTTDGDLIVTATKRKPKKFTNIRHTEFSEESFDKALEKDKLVIGRTYFFDSLEQWIIPLRYAIKDEKGQPLAVITTAISLESDFNPWRITELDEDRLITIVKSPTTHGEYYHQFAHPPIYPDSLEQTYNEPIPSDLIEYLNNLFIEETGHDIDTLMQSEDIIWYKFFDSRTDQHILDMISYNK